MKIIGDIGYAGATVQVIGRVGISNVGLLLSPPINIYIQTDLIKLIL